MHPLVLVVSLSVAAQHVPDAVLKRGTLSFDGHATLGDFVGTTDSVRGAMTGGADLTAVRGWVEAPVATLATGNGKRDRDLRKSMEVERYPTMRFDLAAVTVDGGTPDSVAATLGGTMAIHGVRKEIDIPATVVRRGDRFHVRASFPLNLKDYGIGGLTKLLGILKMDEHTVVHIDLEFAP
jgi:polyisoprenoid-binding protein YceI